MKKTILILATILLSYSCSKDNEEYDPRNDLSYINFQNERFKGIWYFDKVIKADGSIEDYVHMCPANKDYADFQSNRIMDFLHWDTENCSDFYVQTNCQNFQVQGYTLSSRYTHYEGTYSLQGNALRVDYAEVEYFGQVENNLETAKGLIFSRN
ncbi:hypothetical protein H9X57_12435 [Flavobacterium piscinae]|uniref:hypothetical protein n=1 Tax=Flavobacterium piscinae TaxID=2506424 RepID=UPI0019B8EF5F|nr:hypothetical protein [Flavobacterium piscinae]MBC8883859.1 hypothetical protein [Flavobacterium piscinae]